MALLEEGKYLGHDRNWVEAESRFLAGRVMSTTVPAPATCIQCHWRPADCEDGMCSICRSESAATLITEMLTDALENFLDNRWSPRRPSGPGPIYCFDTPTFDDTTLDDIKAAYNQVVGGTPRLIELAVGRPVEMQYGIRYQDTKHYGIRAQVEWDYLEEPAKEPATVTEPKPAIASHEEWK